MGLETTTQTRRSAGFWNCQLVCVRIALEGVTQKRYTSMCMPKRSIRKVCANALSYFGLPVRGGVY